MACALAAHWAAWHRCPIHGMLLVAPADVESAAHTPDAVRGFSPMPLQTLPGSCMVVASADDPFVDPARARFFAKTWGGRFVDAGKCGHINAASGLGDWPYGKRHLEELISMR